MKKVIAVMLALVMAFALCVPSFAEGEEAGSGFDFSAIIEQIQQIIGGIGGGDGEEGGVQLPDIGGIIEGIIGGIGGGDGEEGGDVSLPEISLPEIDWSTVTPEQAATIISIMQKAGASKEEIQATLDEMLASEQIPQEAYDLLKAALDAAPETTTNAPVVSDEQVAEAAQKIIDVLRKAGVSNDQMQDVVDQLAERGIIPQNVYEEITKRINDSEATTAASNEGGIGGFISGIVDKIKGLFGGDSGDGDGNGNNGGDSSNYEGKEPTGDTAILSVAAVAAVAGVALVLTRKKKDAE